MQDIAVQFEKHCWTHSVSLFPPQVHVGRSPIINYKNQILKLKKQKINKVKNFFIKIFSFGKININQNINNLIRQEEENCELLKGHKSLKFTN